MYASDTVELLRSLTDIAMAVLPAVALVVIGLLVARVLSESAQRVEAQTVPIARALSRVLRDADIDWPALSGSPDPWAAPEEIRTQVSAMFLSAQRAATSGDLTRVRGFMEEPALAVLKERMAADAQAGVRRVVDGLRVDRVQLLPEYADDPRGTLRVAIHASAVTEFRDLRTGLAVEAAAGSPWRQDWMEYWSLRPLPAETAARGGPHKCANCGAPMDDSSLVRCSYCEAAIPRASNATTEYVVTAIAAA
jgi:hypothetical protein